MALAVGANEVAAMIGEGGMGEVYRATDTKVGGGHRGHLRH